MSLRPDLPASGPDKLPSRRAVRLLGLAHQRLTRGPRPGTGPAPLHQLPGHCPLVNRHLRCALLRFGPDRPIAPTGPKYFGRIILQINHGRTLPSRRGGANDLPHQPTGPAASPSRGRGSGGQFCQCGPLHPQNAAHPCVDRNGPGTAPAHGQRSRTGKPQRGSQRPLPQMSPP